MTRRTTVYDLQSLKGRRKWLQLHVDNAEEAAAAVACDITSSFDRFTTLAQSL